MPHWVSIPVSQETGWRQSALRTYETQLLNQCAKIVGVIDLAADGDIRI